MNLNDKEFVSLKEQLARIEVKLDDIPEIKADLKEYGSRLERQSEKQIRLTACPCKIEKHWLI